MDIGQSENSALVRLKQMYQSIAIGLLVINELKTMS